MLRRATISNSRLFRSGKDFGPSRNGHNGRVSTDAPTDAPADDPIEAAHRAYGVEANNSIWDLVGEPASPERDEELLRRAYASAYHWQRAARRTPVNEMRARYMLSKVHHLTGQPERALHYADATMALCLELGVADFDLAYAHEVSGTAALASTVTLTLQTPPGAAAIAKPMKAISATEHAAPVTPGANAKRR